MTEPEMSEEEIWQKGAAVARQLEEYTMANHLFSDNEVRVYAVAQYKWTEGEYPEKYKGFRGDWAVYIGGASIEDGMNVCIQKVLRCGNKLPEKVARAMFGGLAEKLDSKKITYRA